MIKTAFILALLPVVAFSGLYKPEVYNPKNLDNNTSKNYKVEHHACRHCIVNHNDWAFGFTGIGFKGTYIQGKPLINNTFEVQISNTAKHTVVWNFDIKDLQLNIADIQVSAVYEAEMEDLTKSIDLTFAPQTSKTIIYKLTGELKSEYKTLIGLWNKFFFTYYDNQSIQIQQ